MASADHRFLTERGWKYVTGTMSGAARRPYLTTGNTLLGFGAMADPPKVDADYRRGYLTGMIRGDGSLGVYEYAGPGSRVRRVHRFRLALAETKRWTAAVAISTARGCDQDLSVQRGDREARRDDGDPDQPR